MSRCSGSRRRSGARACTRRSCGRQDRRWPARRSPRSRASTWPVTRCRGRSTSWTSCRAPGQARSSSAGSGRPTGPAGAPRGDSSRLHTAITEPTRRLHSGPLTWLRSATREVHGMKRLLGLVAGVLAGLLLLPAQASASALTDCLAKQGACLTGDGRPLVSQAQQAKLERQIGSDPIYLVVAPSGPSGYNGSMNEIIAALSGHDRFPVGFLDTRLRHFGAYNSGMLPAHGAADIATRVVQQHQGDQDVSAALTTFVTDVKQQAEPGSAAAAAAADPASHALRNLLITLGIIAAIA